MAKQTRDERVVAANDLVAGVQHYFTASNTSLTVAGVTLPPAAVIAALQSRVKAADATALAVANLAKAYADEAANEQATRAVVNGVKQLALMMYAHDPEALSLFGLAPRKVPAPPTLEEKEVRVAKAKATRLARGTMGPRAKAKVKGTV
jgi:hypothetical protein